MKILLLHALNPEARLIKRQYPQKNLLINEAGVELLELDRGFDLLRTGIGLSRTEAALQHIPEPSAYSAFLQFGVSGSLSEALPAHTMICAQSFTALNEEEITRSEMDISGLPDLTVVRFFSSMEVVRDETSRQVAISHGAQAVDMESYAVARFCAQHSIPLRTVRIISDRAGASTPEEFKKNFGTATRILQQHIIQHVLQR